jgi:hypothetical protein
MIKMLHNMGIKSGHLYAAGIASIGLSFGSWVVSKSSEKAGIDRADRWGIFIGQWAPTLFAAGVALRLEETRHDATQDVSGESDIFDKASGGVTSRTRAGV